MTGKMWVTNEKSQRGHESTSTLRMGKWQHYQQKQDELVFGNIQGAQSGGTADCAGDQVSRNVQKTD